MKKIFTLILAATALFSVVSCEETTETTIQVESVAINKDAVTLSIGGTESLTVSVLPTDAEDVSVTWSSNDTSVATVSESGLVTAIAAGEATITVSSNAIPSLTDKCVVTVKEGYVLTISDATAEIYLGEAFQLSFTYTPAEDAEPQVEWSSDDEAIAYVTSDGYVTGVGAGVTNIVVACTDDPTISATCVVTVNYDPSMNLSDFSADNYPAEDTWYINSDATTSTSNFDGLMAALQAVYDLDNSRKISLEFNNLEYFATEVFNEGRAPMSLYSISAPLVVDIADYSFMGASGIVNISIPAAKIIGYYAFYGCSSLATVDITAVETMWDSALSGCSSLVSVTANNLTEIGHYLFEDCSSLETVIMPLIPNVTDYMFSSCSSLVNVELNSIVGINNGGFEKCSSLVSVDFPTVIECGFSVFEKCYALETVSLAELSHCEDAIFYKCTSLKSAYLPKLAYQYYMTFASCAALEEITIGTECVITCVGDDYGDVFNGVDLSNVTLTTGTDNGTTVAQNGDLWDWTVPYDGGTYVYAGFKNIVVQ